MNGLVYFVHNSFQKSVQCMICASTALYCMNLEPSTETDVLVLADI